MLTLGNSEERRDWPRLFSWTTPEIANGSDNDLIKLWEDTSENKDDHENGSNGA